MEGIGRGRGRARGRAFAAAAPESELAQLQIRRPSPVQQDVVPIPGGLGSSERTSSSASGGRGSSGRTFTDPSQAEAPVGRASAAAVPRQPLREAPGVGRGSSRGREARTDNQLIYRTLPNPGFVKQGKDGTPLPLIANYFELISKPNYHLWQYRVDYSPEIDHMGVRKSLLRPHEGVIGKYIFDGTLLYNIRSLPQPLELISNRISDNSEVRLTLKLVGEIHKEDNFYSTVMNIIFRRCLNMLKLTEIRRDYYDPQNAEDIPRHNLTVYPGYHTTIKFHEEGFLLGVEIIHKVLRKDTALNVMDKIRREDSGDFRAKVKATLEGQIVMTMYNKKTYRIDEVDFDQNPKSTFHLRKENRDVTYIDYYLNRYNAPVTNGTQPLLVSRPTRRDLNRGDDKPIFLIPELCTMTGLTDEQRANFGVMKDVGAVTRVNPDRRVESLMKFRKRLADTPEIQRELDSWGLHFSDDLVKIVGRMIDPQTIQQGNSYPTSQGSWDRQVQKGRYYSSPLEDFTKWIVIYPQGMEKDTIAFVDMMKLVGTPHNFPIPHPKYLSTDRPAAYVEKIRDEVSQQDYQMVMIMIRSRREDYYQAVKQVTLCEFGIPSQVVTQRVICDPKKSMSVATKVTIQVASKLGAEPWTIKMPVNKFMVVGYDTYHDKKQSRAVGAFVASTNHTFSKYHSSVKHHQHNEEISPSFKDHMLKCLKSFYHKNQFLPEKVIVYRDGVGSGDVARIRETEILMLKQACSEAAERVRSEKVPAVAFIVVSKRINTRLFTMRGRPGNPEPGTVVDTKVTLNERYDFFLVSQKVNQGTVSPTSYHIIEDNTGISPDRHQLLAYKVSHVYFNWPGILSIPGPVQYAHKLAYLVGESLGMKTPKDSLANLPYYL